MQKHKKYKDNAGADQEGPNFVQVSDNRGTETGWTLKVKQNGQFKTEVNQELAAKVTLSNGRWFQLHNLQNQRQRQLRLN